MLDEIEDLVSAALNAESGALPCVESTSSFCEKHIVIVDNGEVKQFFGVVESVNEV